MAVAIPLDRARHRRTPVAMIAVIALVVLLASSVAGVRWYQDSGPRVVVAGASGSGQVPADRTMALTVPLQTTGGGATVESVRLAQPDSGVVARFAMGEDGCTWGFAGVSILAGCALHAVHGARIGAASSMLVVEYHLNAQAEGEIAVPDVLVTYRSGFRTWTTALHLQVSLCPPVTPVSPAGSASSSCV